MQKHTEITAGSLLEKSRELFLANDKIKRSLRIMPEAHFRRRILSLAWSAIARTNIKSIVCRPWNRLRGKSSPAWSIC